MTNHVDGTPSMDELLTLYKSQQRIEIGFRFLKDPAFMTSAFFVEKASHIEALLFLMNGIDGLCRFRTLDQKNPEGKQGDSNE